jgi:4'-phosphopantetheinyl transferase EntD
VTGDLADPGGVDPSGLLPEDVALRSGDPGAPTPLHEGERHFVERAVSSRRLEFANGRRCARLALAALGGPEAAIPVGPQRDPVWPADYVGSITHTHGWCDAEPAVALSPAVMERIGDEQEVRRAAEATGVDLATAAHLVFSAKEAFYKCHFMVARTYLGFEDVRIEVSDLELKARLLRRVGASAPGESFSGRWRRSGGLFLTAFWGER